MGIKYNRKVRKLILCRGCILLLHQFPSFEAVYVLWDQSQTCNRERFDSFYNNLCDSS